MQNLQDILQSESKTFLDVRTHSEYNQHHIENAVHIPLNEIPNRLDEIKTLSKPIVVYCLSGGRSANATNYLKQNNVEEVYNGGGISMLEMMLI